jgi:hypothetical protein
LKLSRTIGKHDSAVFRVERAAAKSLRTPCLPHARELFQQDDFSSRAVTAVSAGRVSIFGGGCTDVDLLLVMDITNSEIGRAASAQSMGLVETG